MLQTRGNGGPAQEAGIHRATDLAVGADGTIYVLEGDDSIDGRHVRRIGPDGIISTVIVSGVGVEPWCADPELDLSVRASCHPCAMDRWRGGDAVPVSTFTAIDTSPNGELYVAIWAHSAAVVGEGACVAEILPDGGLRRVMGYLPQQLRNEGDGVPATEFRANRVLGLQAGRDRLFLRTEMATGSQYTYAVHTVQDGYVFPVALEDTSFAPTTATHDFSDAVLPAGLRVVGYGAARSPGTFALAPQGDLAIATINNATSLVAIQRLYAGASAGVRDGGVRLEFHGRRHVRTSDAMTGAMLRTFERNTEGLVTAIVDADGNRVEVQRGTGYVRFVPPFGPATRIEDTDDDGWADRVEYEDAALRGYDLDHDERGLLQSIARPDGLTHQFIYDELGRLIRDEQPGGRVARLTREPTDIDLDTRRLTQTVTYTSPGGRSTRHETEFGRPGSSTRRTLTHPDGTTTVVEQLPRRPIEPADGLEGAYVRETRATASDGTVTELFETIGNGAGFSDPVPARTTITTPAPSSRQLHLEQTRARTHDPATGEMLTETRTHTRRGGSTSRTVTSSYDAATRTFTTTLPSELSSSTVLDASDRPIEVRAPGLAPLQMTYDARGRLTSSRRVSATGHGTREVSYDYTDPVLGELWTPSTVTSAGARTHLSFDDLRRMTSGVTLPVSCMVDADCDDGVGCNGEETCASGECVPGATNTCSMFAYDTVDRLTGVRPLGREEHGLGYDAADRGISYTPPVLSGPSGQVDLARDPDGLVSRVDVDAGPTRSVVTSRHSDGRPQSVQHDGHTITFGYHATTRELTSLATEDGITVSLDTDGPLLESVTWSGSAGVAGAVAFGYDDLWDLSTITAGGLATSYHHDEDGALDCVAPGGTADATCASGLLIAPNLPARTLVMSMAGAASVMSSYEWSDLGEATQTVHQWSTTGELSFTYDERDGEGRLTRVIEDDGAGDLVLEYSYDVEGRLIEVKRDGDVSESYEYDPNGQRITATRDDVPVTPIAWDARDRLTQYGGVTYEYDPAGRRTTRTEGGRTTTYTYDLLGALRAVDLPDTTNDIEYLIDGAGRRVGRKVGPIGSGTLERAWIYLDGLRPIVEMDGSGTVTRIFVYGAGRAPDLIVVPAGQPDAGTYRVLTDHLDSVRRVVNVANGAVIQQLDYDAFGNVLVDTNPGWQPLGFAAGLYDPGARDPACVLAGGRYCGALVRFGARDYDPEIGLWTARDPILFGGGDGNLYLYSSGDPRNHIDATGRNPVAVAVGVVVIAAMLWALNPNHAGDIGRKSVKRSACGRSLPNTVWIGAAIEADGGYADMAVDAAIHLVTLGVASELSVLSTRFATSAVVRNSWFRLDTVGRWRSIVTRQWQSGTHFHFDPFPGSRELMRWHLPHELKPWLYNARSIVRRYVSRSRR